MSAFMRFSPFKGPVSFEFIDPDTGYHFKAPNRQALLSHIISYRAQNFLPPIDLINTVIDNYLCSLPENCGSCEPNKLPRGFLPTLKGGMALVQNMIYSSYVSQEEADRRANICVNCPNNVFPDKGTFVDWADRVAEASLVGRKSKHHSELGNCSVCTCLLRSKVFFGGKIDISEKDRENYPSFCWQLDSQNKDKA